MVRPGQVLTFGVENRLTEVLSGTQLTTFGYDGDGKRTIQTTVSGTTLFVGPLYEVFVPVSATMPTITSTVYPTQTYTARLPVVTGSWHGVDGALGEVTKYYFADGRRIAMRAGNGGEPTYLYQDHLGSTVASSDGADRGGRGDDRGVDEEALGVERELRTRLPPAAGRALHPISPTFAVAEPIWPTGRFAPESSPTSPYVSRDVSLCRARLAAPWLRDRVAGCRSQRSASERRQPRSRLSVAGQRAFARWTAGLCRTATTCS